MKHFKKAICNEIFENWKISDVLQYAAHLGYDGVEIAPHTLAERVEKIDSAQRRDIREAVESNKIEIVGLHLLLFSPRGLYLNHPDALIRTKTVDYLKTLIVFCAEIGGKIVVFGSGKQRNIYPDLTPQKAWEYAVDSFRRVLKTAEKHGVTVCIEPLSYRLTNFVCKASEALKMVEEIDHPNFKMMLDVRSATDDEKPIPDLIRDSAPHLAHFHANDDNGKAPGTGNADYKSISDTLREIGYHGYLSVEVFDFKPDPKTIARESLKTLQRYFN